MSITIIVAVQVLTLPLLSVTVKVEVLPPTLAQLKLVGDALRLAMPQASLEPLSISEVVMLPLPLASRFTVTF